MNVVFQAADFAEFAARIHASGRRLVLSGTGGGTLAVPALLTVPGGSRSVLEAVVPYSAAALDAWLGVRPEHYCDADTARAMAMAAYERAARLSAAGKPAPLPLGEGRGEGPGTNLDTSAALVGIGCTASLVSDRPKRGPHRIHVAAQSAEFTTCSSLTLSKGSRDRQGEEALAARLLLNVVAEACDVDEPLLPLDLLSGERVERERTDAPEPIRELFKGRVAVVSAAAFRASSRAAAKASAGATPRAVFPGAFHPLHHGHRRMAAIAAERLGCPVEFELSIANVDKLPLDFTEMRRRAEQFDPDETLWLTQAATFVEKAALFPGATFVVGADTIIRIADPRYYGDDDACRRAIDALAARGCRFLVFGRCGAAGFQCLADLRLPDRLRTLCNEVPVDDFREDISSTELRRREAHDAD